jgi:hypothetical protein
MSNATRLEVLDGVTAWLTDDTASGDVACWTVRSDGLRPLGHPEVAFPIRVTAGLDRTTVANTLVSLLRAISRVAATGQRVTAGGVTRLGQPMFGFDGVFYVPAQSIGDRHVPSSTLFGIFASADELAGVERFGARRLCSLLARQTRYFPYPPWSDPARERIAFSTWATVLAQMPVVGLPGATVMQQSGALHLRLGRTHSAPILRAALAQLADTPPTFALHEVDARADACLVWSPGQQEAAAVAPPNASGERLGGCFLATANQQADNASQIVEDGFAYFLRDADDARLRAAWLAGDDVVIRGTARSGDDLIVTWHDDVETPASPNRVRLVTVQLLAEPAATDASIVAAYIRALQTEAARTLPVLSAAYEVLALVWVEPANPVRIELATRPFTPPADGMQTCLAALHAVAAPQVTSKLGFEAHLSVEPTT